MRKEAVVFVLLIALFAAARLWGLADYCLDCDEIFSLKVARQSWSGLFTAVAEDVSHPPLFYLLLKGWIGLGGESVFWLRLFPALTATACVVPLLLFCRALLLGWA
jgi:mannosyltransferase